MTLGLARLGSGLRSAFGRRAASRVLFGERTDWHENIRGVLKGSAFEVTFGVLDACDLTRYDLVVPLKLDDYFPLRRKRESAAGRALFPEWETVALCDDKILFNRRMAESGEGESIPTVHASVPSRFPFILKRSRDEHGAHSHIVRDRDDVERFGALIADDAYFLQDYVEGSTEYTTHLLMRNGEVRYFVNVVFEMESEPYVKGAHFAARSTSLNTDARFLETFKSVLRAVGFETGTCCLNYKLAMGRPKIFEMNPRFGGTLVNDLDRYLRAYSRAVRAR